MIEGNILEAWVMWKASHPLWTFLIFEVAGILGMITHFLKKDIQGQTADDIVSYFKNNFKRTLWATITTVFAVFTAFIMSQGLMAAFLAGYAFDSALNQGSK